MQHNLPIFVSASSAMEDISSPEKYDLRRRSSLDTFDSDIPPYMFQDMLTSDSSSYSYSKGFDISLEHSIISSQEVSWLHLHGESSTTTSSSTSTDVSSIYWKEHCRKSKRWQTILLSSSDEATTIEQHHQLSSNTGGGEKEQLQLHSLSSTDTWGDQLNFPLHCIGSLQASHLTPEGQLISTTPIDIVDSSLSKSENTSCSSLKPGDYICESYNSITDARDIHDAIDRTFWWFARSGYEVTEAVYWAIRSLTYFYAVEILRAEQAGARPLKRELPPLNPRFESGEIPRGLPDYVKCIITIDGLYSKDLRGITTKQAAGRTHRKARWFPPQTVSVREIPIRELDDPPDDSSGITQTEVDWCMTGEGWFD